MVLPTLAWAAATTVAALRTHRARQLQERMILGTGYVDEEHRAHAAFEFAAIDFEFMPPPTDAEQAEASRLAFEFRNKGR